VADQIGIRRLQLTHEFVNPEWPSPVLRRLTREYANIGARYGVAITSVCTGACGRLNNLGHPDKDVRRWTVAWLKRLATLAVDLGASSMGSQFAILTYRDYDDVLRRETIVEHALDGWCEVWEHASCAGLKFLF
jgi:sugar phosphate isomerase/epimerase